MTRLKSLWSIRKIKFSYFSQGPGKNMAPSTGSLMGIFHRDHLQRCRQGVGRAIGMVQTPSGVTGKGGAGYEDPERAVSGGGLIRSCVLQQRDMYHPSDPEGEGAQGKRLTSLSSLPLVSCRHLLDQTQPEAKGCESYCCRHPGLPLRALEGRWK